MWVRQKADGNPDVLVKGLDTESLACTQLPWAPAEGQQLRKRLSCVASRGETERQFSSSLCGACLPCSLQVGTTILVLSPP